MPIPEVLEAGLVTKIAGKVVQIVKSPAKLASVVRKRLTGRLGCNRRDVRSSSNSLACVSSEAIATEILSNGPVDFELFRNNNGRTEAFFERGDHALLITLDKTSLCITVSKRSQGVLRPLPKGEFRFEIEAGQASQLDFGNLSESRVAEANESRLIRTLLRSKLSPKALTADEVDILSQVTASQHSANESRGREDLLKKLQTLNGSGNITVSLAKTSDDSFSATVKVNNAELFTVTPNPAENSISIVSKGKFPSTASLNVSSAEIQQASSASKLLYAFKGGRNIAVDEKYLKKLRKPIYDAFKYDSATKSLGEQMA